MAMKGNYMKGYTLLEMLITISVFSLCLLLVCSSMIYGVNAYNSIRAKIDSKAQLLTAFDILRDDLKHLTANPSPIIGDISDKVEKVASWKIHSKKGVQAVQYAVEDGKLTRTLDGKATPILNGECDFEVKFLSQKLAWVSIKYGKETLTSHIRPELASN